MKWEFYDVKAKAKVKAEVIGKKVYGEEKRARYAFKGETADKRPLTAFVCKADYDKCTAKVLK
ncbi:MAG: hypothetical protein IKD44_01380 [Lentisphaeria bacterium]|nr:hypothetical protein [Lentisphaeria bacterium]